MKLQSISFVLLLLWGCAAPPSQAPVPAIDTNPEITADEFLGHIKYLASDELKGRRSGSPEDRIARDYIVRQFKAAGIEPLNPDGSYFQNYEFVKSLDLGSDNQLSFGGKTFTAGTDFTPLGFSSNGALDAEAVWVGYGFDIGDSLNWHDYDSVSVQGKWVVILRGGPDDNRAHSPFDSHLALRKKVLVARDHQAGGVIFVSQPDDEDLIKLR
ncbi:MAG: hypothetical protein ACE5D1_00440, partial [Fidelibacterota bacterium]